MTAAIDSRQKPDIIMKTYVHWEGRSEWGGVYCLHCVKCCDLLDYSRTNSVRKS